MSFFDDIFGGLFDFNGDGKTTWDEEWLGYKIFEDIEKENKESDDIFNSSIFHDDTVFDEDSDLSDKSKNVYSWRDSCEDGLEYDVYAEDYETEEEYEEALEEAKNSCRENCIDGSNVGALPEDYEVEDEYNQSEYNEDADYSPALTIPVTLTFSVECPALDKLNAIKEKDYPNKRQYEAAYTLNNEFLIYSDKEIEQKQKAICNFILKQSSTVIAANYLTLNNGFLFAQAVKNYFTLPIELPNEDAEPNTYFTDMLKKIAQRDIRLSLKIWDWCVEQFMPYANFVLWSDKTLTCETIDDLYEFPKQFKPELIQYLGEHPAFCHALFRDAPELASDAPDLIYVALQSGNVNISKLIFEDSLIKADKYRDILIRLINGVILWCNNGDELESMEHFQLDLFPLVLKYANDELEEKIGAWKDEMVEYIREMERDNEKYAFTRCNSWRNTVPDGKKYGLDVCNYVTEQEYLDDLNEKKYGWRLYYDRDDCLELNPNDYETQREFDVALEKQKVEKEKRFFQQRNKKQFERDKTRSKTPPDEIAQSILDDKNIYIYCGVVFQESSMIYHYRTDDSTIKIGDCVVVPVGRNFKETKAKIVSVGQYTRMSVPFPVEKTRFIKRKLKMNKQNEFHKSYD